MATIELESHLASINSASCTQRDPPSTVSVVSSVVGHEPLSETLKLLNGRLEKLEVQMVCTNMGSWELVNRRLRH